MNNSKVKQEEKEKPTFPLKSALQIYKNVQESPKWKISPLTFFVVALIYERLNALKCAIY